MLCTLSLRPHLKLTCITAVFITAASCVFLLGLMMIVSSVWQRQISTGSCWWEHTMPFCYFMVERQETERSSDKSRNRAHGVKHVQEPDCLTKPSSPLPQYINGKVPSICHNAVK